jgi:hypothetical protein
MATTTLYILITMFFENGQIFTYPIPLTKEQCEAKVEETSKLITEAQAEVGLYKSYCLEIPAKPADQL